MRIKGEMIMGILDIFKAKPEPIAPVREITKNTRIALAPKNIRNFIDETTYQKPVDADSQLDDTLDPESIAENPFDVIFASVIGAPVAGKLIAAFTSAAVQYAILFFSPYKFLYFLNRF
jgi:hypothetical protein